MNNPYFKKYRKYKSTGFTFACIKKGLGSVYRGLFELYPIAERFSSQTTPPFFIVGAGRSGTTLIRSMLAAGGEVAIPVETQILHTLPVKFVAYRGLGWEDLCRLIIANFESHPDFSRWETNLAAVYQRVIQLDKPQRSLARLIHEVYREYAAQHFPEAARWGDQSPINTFYWKNIDKMFPEARYIHMLRDGRDVVASLSDRFGQGIIPTAVQRWKTSIQVTENLQSRVGSRFLLVRYEEITQNTKPVLQKVCDFLDIAFSNQMLDFYKSPSTIENRYDTFHANLGKPVFTSSIGAWKSRLPLEVQDDVNRALAKELAKMGYR